MANLSYSVKGSTYCIFLSCSLYFPWGEIRSILPCLTPYMGVLHSVSRLDVYAATSFADAEKTPKEAVNITHDTLIRLAAPVRVRWRYAPFNTQFT